VDTGKPKPRKRHFEAMDTDGNGSISLDEFTVAHEKRMAARKEKMGDKWNPEIAAKMPSAEVVFGKMDTDENGEVTKEEMKAGRETRTVNAREKGRRGRGHGDHPVGAEKVEEVQE